MSVTDQRPNTRPAVAIGDVVEVKSAEEILAGLDERGELDSLPFMPEMLQFCGRRFVVDKIAFKTCDTATWTGLRRMTDTVHLAGVRCDGRAHGGCQAGCLIFWKTDWLTKISGPSQGLATPEQLRPERAMQRQPGPDAGPAASTWPSGLGAPGNGSPRWPWVPAVRRTPGARRTSQRTRVRPPN